MRRRLVSWALAALVAGVVVAVAQPVGTPVAALLEKYGRELPNKIIAPQSGRQKLRVGGAPENTRQNPRE
jgi:hypothetical protein